MSLSPQSLQPGKEQDRDTGSRLDTREDLSQALCTWEGREQRVMSGGLPGGGGLALAWKQEKAQVREQQEPL